MIRNLLCSLLGAVLLGAPATLQAQSDTALGLAVRWENNLIRIRPHPSLGLRLEAAIAPAGATSAPRRVRAYLDPAAVRSWLDGAATVTAPAGAPSDLYALLATPGLGTVLGDTVVLTRRSLGNVWDTNVVLRVVAIDGGSIEIPLPPNHLSTVLNGMRQAAGQSGYTPDSVMLMRSSRTPARVVEAPGAGVSQPPVPLTPPRMRPPRGAPRGRVLMEFVVGVDGIPESNSIDVVWSDHDDLIPAARNAISEMRFAPAQAGGRPVRLTIRQLLRH
jgi:hypothetical protein